eukprot:gene10096-biopygen22783
MFWLCGHVSGASLVEVAVTVGSFVIGTSQNNALGHAILGATAITFDLLVSLDPPPPPPRGARGEPLGGAGRWMGGWVARCDTDRDRTATGRRQCQLAGWPFRARCWSPTARGASGSFVTARHSRRRRLRRRRAPRT